MSDIHERIVLPDALVDAYEYTLPPDKRFLVSIDGGEKGLLIGVHSDGGFRSYVLVKEFNRTYAETKEKA